MNKNQMQWIMKKEVSDYLDAKGLFNTRCICILVQSDKINVESALSLQVIQNDSYTYVLKIIELVSNTSLKFFTKLFGVITAVKSEMIHSSMKSEFESLIRHRFIKRKEY